jgi:hypothetical protein
LCIAVSFLWEGYSGICLSAIVEFITIWQDLDVSLLWNYRLNEEIGLWGPAVSKKFETVKGMHFFCSMIFVLPSINVPSAWGVSKQHTYHSFLTSCHFLILGWNVKGVEHFAVYCCTYLLSLLLYVAKDLYQELLKWFNNVHVTSIELWYTCTTKCFMWGTNVLISCH